MMDKVGLWEKLRARISGAEKSIRLPTSEELWNAPIDPRDPRGRTILIGWDLAAPDPDKQKDPAT